ncbi:amino acid ABC transporter permease [Shouchella lehensis]|uniref:Amino acid ABC transporter, permease protein n=1 Tax=Shouchella lehensis G1 TaxID=1246626 RepID=A0A060LZM8_9BACI|nr:amino acid ABC transporter permease [Shouchella lehensis]AIC93279.1 amino acid ABC transporter, permease protein [Shouchella lehensis G1]
MAQSDLQPSGLKTSLPPPKQTTSLANWLKENLFTNWRQSLFTLALLSFASWLLYQVGHWVFVTADWSVIPPNFKLLLSGQYPVDQLWRLWTGILLFALLLGLSAGSWKGVMTHVAFFLSLIFLVCLALPFVAFETRLWLSGAILIMGAGFGLGHFFKIKKTVLLVWIGFIPISGFLLHGFGLLPSVGTNLWGGFLLTLLLASVAILCSFPLGLLLALGRRSKLPAIKYFCIFYIELIRGVPLITILFVAQIMLPLLLGGSVSIDHIVRAMIGLTMFNAAYLAENIRGGLQSIPRGQFEAAHALGLGTPVTTCFVILPQALKAVIPSMVGQFIAIFKDTSLVAIVGLIDLLGMARNIAANPEFIGYQMELFLFVALVFFIFCSILSYASRRIEHSLGVGDR